MRFNRSLAPLGQRKNPSKTFALCSSWRLSRSPLRPIITPEIGDIFFCLETLDLQFFVSASKPSLAKMGALRKVKNKRRTRCVST